MLGEPDQGLTLEPQSRFARSVSWSINEPQESGLDVVAV
jgi:hypothetical protein